MILIILSTSKSEFSVTHFYIFFLHNQYDLVSVKFSSHPSSSSPATTTIIYLIFIYSCSVLPFDLLSQQLEASSTSTQLRRVTMRWTHLIYCPQSQLSLSLDCRLFVNEQSSCSLWRNQKRNSLSLFPCNSTSLSSSPVLSLPPSLPYFSNRLCSLSLLLCVHKR